VEKNFGPNKKKMAVPLSQMGFNMYEIAAHSPPTCNHYQTSKVS